MYNVNNSTKYYLYDKQKKACIRKFESMTDVRNYISSCIRFRDNNLHIGMPDKKYFELNDLSMSFEPKYDYSVKRKWIYDPDTEEYTPKYYTEKTLIPEFVIVDENFGIFNYMEIVNELVAIHKKININFGIGKTYKGESTTPIGSKRRSELRWAKYKLTAGSKHHGKGSGSFRLIVNKSERVANNSNLDDNYYDDIAEEISENLNINVDVKMIKRACNSMRSRRRFFAGDVWDNGYSEQYYKWGHPENWKNHKKSKQWKNNKNTAKQTARKDYIKKMIDDEYYFDYESEAC